MASVPASTHQLGKASSGEGYVDMSHVDPNLGLVGFLGVVDFRLNIRNVPCPEV